MFKCAHKWSRCKIVFLVVFILSVFFFLDLIFFALKLELLCSVTKHFSKLHIGINKVGNCQEILGTEEHEDKFMERP